MSVELEKAMWWALGWLRLARTGRIRGHFQWFRRYTWALHRVERAVRAGRNPSAKAGKEGA